jgi:hypothetical protein
VSVNRNAGVWKLYSVTMTHICESLKSLTEIYDLSERCNRVVNALISYSGGSRFKSQRREWLSSLRFFVVFLGPPGK